MMSKMVSSSLCQRLFFFLRACIHSEEAFPLVSRRLHSRCCFTDVRCFSNLQFFFFSLYAIPERQRPPLLPAEVILVSFVSLPLTLVHFLSFFIYVFPSLSHNSCAIPSLCLSLPLRLLLPLYLSPVSSSETSGAKLSLTLFGLFFFFLNLSQLFLVGCLILSKASKRGKKRG